jgi:hypothetical protein
MAEYAPLIASFLHRVFIEPNIRIMAQAELVAKLEDELFHLRENTSTEAFPRSATEYLNDWADNDRGWLRKFYPPDSDEAHFDLTPAAEKAVSWLESLLHRAFVGTESRLLTAPVLSSVMVFLPNPFRFASDCLTQTSTRRAYLIYRFRWMILPDWSYRSNKFSLLKI